MFNFLGRVWEWLTEEREGARHFRDGRRGMSRNHLMTIIVLALLFAYPITVFVILVV